MTMDLVDTELAFARAGASLGDAELASRIAGADEDRAIGLRSRVNAELKRMFAVYCLAGLSFDQLTRAHLAVIFVRAAVERVGALIVEREQQI